MIRLPEWTAEMDRRLLARGLGALLLAAALLGFVFLPASRQILRQAGELRQLRRRIAEARLMAQELPRRETAARASEERYRAMAGRVGRGQSVARILEAFSAQAKARHLEYGAVQTPSEEAGRLFSLGPMLTVREVPLTLQLAGRYRQLGEFLGELPAGPYLASVRRLTLTRPDGDSLKVKADLSLSVYLAEEGPAR